MNLKNNFEWLADLLIIEMQLGSTIRLVSVNKLCIKSHCWPEKSKINLLLHNQYFGTDRKLAFNLSY